MRIPCPHCGERDVREFVYLGDATAARPSSDDPSAAARYVEFVYVRTNPAGKHREFWYHGSGCQAWLVVTRDTTTHEITAVEVPSADTVAQ